MKLKLLSLTMAISVFLGQNAFAAPGRLILSFVDAHNRPVAVTGNASGKICSQMDMVCNPDSKDIRNATTVVLNGNVTGGMSTVEGSVIGNYTGFRFKHNVPMIPGGTANLKIRVTPGPVMGMPAGNPNMGGGGNNMPPGGMGPGMGQP